MESKEVVIATTASTKVRIVFFILFILFSVAKLSFFLQLLWIMTAIQLRAELLRELNPILDSEVAMLKALTAIRDIRQKVLTQVSVQNTSVRKGWSAAARKAHKQGDDQFVTADIFEDDKVEDWQW